MKVLLGTTNPAKVRYFEEILAGCGLEFVTPDALGIASAPDEAGATPEENAIIKARYYGQFAECAVCNDSGLYLLDLPLDDARQPGLNIRTPGGVRRLNDDEMIAHYTALARRLGGRARAAYLNGAAVYRGGEIVSFMETPVEAQRTAFYLIDTPSPRRRQGWPLDSISVEPDTGTYFVDRKPGADAAPDGYKIRLGAFLRRALGV